MTAQVQIMYLDSKATFAIAKTQMSSIDFLLGKDVPNPSPILRADADDETHE
jgi:hypothetical protein